LNLVVCLTVEFQVSGLRRGGKVKRMVTRVYHGEGINHPRLRACFQVGALALDLGECVGRGLGRWLFLGLLDGSVEKTRVKHHGAEHREAADAKQDLSKGCRDIREQEKQDHRCIKHDGVYLTKPSCAVHGVGFLQNDKTVNKLEKLLDDQKPHEDHRPRVANDQAGKHGDLR